MNDVEWQERLRNVRESCLLQEPDVPEDHVVISVKHITQGVVTRAFYPTSSLMQLYDWVGSLQLDPENFKLVSPIMGKIWLPETKVTDASKCILNMIKCDEPISLLSNDHDVNTAGFAYLDETPTRLLASDLSCEVPTAEEEDDSENKSMDDSWYVLLSYYMYLMSPPSADIFRQ